MELVTNIKPAKRDLHAEAREILEFLNKKTGRNFRPTSVNTKFLLDRFKEGYTMSDCKAVVAMKCREWPPGHEYNMYLRPATLFNASKFNSYVGFVGSDDE